MGTGKCAGKSMVWHLTDRRVLVQLFPGKDLASTQPQVQRAAQ